MFSNWFNVGLKMALRLPFDFDIIFNIVTDHTHYYGKEEICKVCQQNINCFAISEKLVKNMKLLECLVLIGILYLEIAYPYVEAMRDRKMFQWEGHCLL